MHAVMHYMEDVFRVYFNHFLCSRKFLAHIKSHMNNNDFALETNKMLQLGLVRSHEGETVDA